MTELDQNLTALGAQLRAAVRDPGPAGVVERVRRRAQRKAVSGVAVGVVAAMGLLYGTLGPSVSMPVDTAVSGRPTPVNFLDFVDEQHGYAVRSDCPPGAQLDCVNTVLVTADGGRSWTSRPVPREVERARLLRLRNPAVGTLGILSMEYWVSADDGRTWKQAPAHGNGPDAEEIPRGGFLETCAAETTANCIREVVRVVDPGTGQRRTLKTQPALEISHGMVFRAPARDGAYWVAGRLPGTERPALAVTRDLGRSWQVVEPPELPRGSQLGEPVLSPDGVHYAPVLSGENLWGVLRSTDGGRTWTYAGARIDTGNLAAGTAPMRLRGVLVPGKGGQLRFVDPQGRTWRSNDGGRIFELERDGIPGKEVEWSRGGFLSWTQVGQERTYYRSTDGVTWQAVRT